VRTARLRQTNLVRSIRRRTGDEAGAVLLDFAAKVGDYVRVVFGDVELLRRIVLFKGWTPTEEKFPCLTCTATDDARMSGAKMFRASPPLPVAA